jgi:hypothetical protein
MFRDFSEHKAAENSIAGHVALIRSYRKAVWAERADCAILEGAFSWHY